MWCVQYAYKIYHSYVGVCTAYTYMLLMQENDTYGRVKRGWLYWLMNSTLVNLKGVVLHEIFDFRFLHELGTFSRTQSIPLGLFRIFTKFAEIQCIRNCMFIAGINDTEDNLFTGVNDTSDKLSLVSLIPAINYCWCHWHRRFRLVPDSHWLHDIGD